MSERSEGDRFFRLTPWWVAEGLGKYAMTDELLALRARVGQLEAALLDCKRYAEDYNDGSIPHRVDAALKDAPQ